MDTVIFINEVSVFAGKTLEERAIVSSEIDSSVLSQNESEELGNLLSRNSFIYIRSYGYGGLSTASFRGTAASHTRLYWNGMEVNDPASGQVDFSLIPVSFIDEIKILHGSSSLQKGSGALGGSIHLSSLPEWKDGVKASVYQRSGSFHTHNSQARISAGIKNIHFKIRALHRSSQNNFEYLNTANGLWNREKLESADSRRSGLQTDLFLRSGNQSVFSFHTWFQKTDRNFAPVMSYMGPSRQENQNDMNRRFSIKWKNYGRYLSSGLSLGFFQNQLNYSLGIGDLQTHIYQTSANTTELQGRYEAGIRLSPFTRIKVLGEITSAKLNYDDLLAESGFTASRNEAGVSFSLHHAFKPEFTVYGLLRNDLYGEELSPFMPAAGMEYNFQKPDGLTMRSNISRNYNYPGLNDLFWNPGGNPELKPEESYSGDLSLEYEKEFDGHRIENTISTFYSSINDWILWKPGEYGFWKADNVARVRATGAEYRLFMELNFFDFKSKFTATYAFTHTTNRSDPQDNSYGMQLIYIPLHKFNFNTVLEYRNFSLAYTSYAVGERNTYTDNDPSGRLAPFSLHDLRFSKAFSLGEFDLETGAELCNLFDTDYQVIRSRPMPGRNYNIWVRLLFK
jgi:iron complex outermembrane receptor protein